MAARDLKELVYSRRGEGRGGEGSRGRPDGASFASASWDVKRREGEYEKEGQCGLQEGREPD